MRLTKTFSLFKGSLLEQRHSGHAAQERRPAFQTRHHGNRSPFRRAVAIVSISHMFIYQHVFIGMQNTPQARKKIKGTLKKRYFVLMLPIEVV